MQVTNDNFGPLIAYLVPGATALLGFSQFSPTLRSWFAATPAHAPTIGGFLYLTVASVAVGMIVSAVRWAVVDTPHSLTGLPLPPINFSRLGKNVEAFGLLIKIHYEHFQFHSNMLVATAIAYTCYRVKLGSVWPLGLYDVAFVGLEVVFYLTSRDTLRKYYVRSQQLLAGTSSHCPPATPAGLECTLDTSGVTNARATRLRAGPRSQTDSHREPCRSSGAELHPDGNRRARTC